MFANYYFMNLTQKRWQYYVNNLVAGRLFSFKNTWLYVLQEVASGSVKTDPVTANQLSRVGTTALTSPAPSGTTQASNAGSTTSKELTPSGTSQATNASHTTTTKEPTPSESSQATNTSHTTSKEPIPSGSSQATNLGGTTASTGMPLQWKFRINLSYFAKSVAWTLWCILPTLIVFFLFIMVKSEQMLYIYMYSTCSSFYNKSVSHRYNVMCSQDHVDQFYNIHKFVPTIDLYKINNIIIAYWEKKRILETSNFCAVLY